MATDSAQLAVGSEAPERPEVQSIVLCHLESLTCLPALNRLFSRFGDRIKVVVLSQRFGAGHGGFFAQLWQNLRTSGVRMTFWLGFDLISAEIVGAVARLIPFGESRKLLSLPSLARLHGAAIIRTSDVNSAALVQQLSTHMPDLILVMNFDQILQPIAISVPRFGVVNVHPSLLPDLRGPCPVFWALAERRRTTGTTVHLIDDARIDAGPIISQREVSIDPSSTVAELNSYLFLNGVSMLDTVLTKVRRGEVHTARDTRAGSYRGFPRGDQVAVARGIGVRLCSFRYLLLLILAALGLRRFSGNKFG